MTDVELEAWYRRILAFDKHRHIQRRRSAAIAHARRTVALALAATFSASAAVAVVEAAKRDQAATDD